MTAAKARMRRSSGMLMRVRGNPRALYLVARRAELAFFGGYWAFPGGVVDAGDAALAAGPGGAQPDDDAVMCVAAARELFEETGVLCTRGARLEAPARAALRLELLNGRATFAELLARHGLEVDAPRFVPVCWMTTPIFSPVRYETLFFLVDVDPADAPSIVDGELTAGEFVEARVMLERWRQGEVLLVPPSVILLELLASAPGPDPTAAFIASARTLTASYARGKIHKICFTPGVRKLPLTTETLPPATSTNAYLVGQDPAYLIDPGASQPGEHAKLFEALDDAAADGVRLHAVLLTHAHRDHASGVPAVVQRYGLPVWAHADAVSGLAGTATVARTLADGEMLPLGTSPDGRPGWTLQVLHTPGHAPGHLAFRESRYGAILAGDMISTVSTIVIVPPDGHMRTYLKSLARLRALPAATLYPAHGPAKRDSHAVLDAYVTHRAQRERKIIGALGAEPRTPDEILPLAYDDTAPEAWPLARMSLDAGLIKLCEDGIAVETGRRYALAAH